MPDTPTDSFAIDDAPETLPERGRPLGRYRVARRLGSGGFSHVYLAHDPELELDVAIKLLKPELAAEPDTVERFRREAGTAARLRHPHVITVLTVGRLDAPFDGAPPGTPFLVMDYLPASLATRLAAGVPLPELELLRIGEEVARGLAHAHRQGVVHRDVKPDNVLFAADGRAVVTDFGIARAVQGGSVVPSRQVVLGTPAYFSPEQARGLPLDGRSDLYSLGVTLYQMATGTLPFEGDDWYTVMRQHVETPPPPPRERAPAISPALEAVILRALSKDPDGRFPTADSLADALGALRAARHSGETMAVPAYPTGGARPVRRRTPVVAAVVGAAALLGGLALWGMLHDAGARTRAALGEGTADSARVDSASVAAGLPGALPLPLPPDTAALTAPRESALVVRGPAALALEAPAAAILTLDGVRLGRGAWRSDSVPPGRHVVAAALAGEPGCPTATVSETVTLAPGDRRALRLRPLDCGRLALDVQPVPARYSIARRDGGPGREGALPAGGPLLLPEGRWRLRVEARYCAPYDDDVTVAAGTLRTERIRLLCN